MQEPDRRYKINRAEQLYYQDPRRAIEVLSKTSVKDLDEALDFSEASQRPLGSSPTAVSTLGSPERPPFLESRGLRPRGPSNSSHGTSHHLQKGYASARSHHEASSAASSASSTITTTYEFPNPASDDGIEHLRGKDICHKHSFITRRSVARFLTNAKSTCNCRATEELTVLCAEASGGVLTSKEHISLTYLLPDGPSDKRLFHVVESLPGADIFLADNAPEDDSYCYTAAQARNNHSQPIPFASFREATTDRSSRTYQKPSSSKGTPEHGGSVKVNSSTGASARSTSTRTSFSRAGSVKAGASRSSTSTAEGNHSRASQSGSMNTVVRGTQSGLPVRSQHTPSSGSALPLRTATSVGSARSSVRAPSDVGHPEVASRVGTWMRDVSTEDAPDEDSVRALYVFDGSTVRDRLNLRAPYNVFLESLTSKLGRVCTQRIDRTVHFALVRHEYHNGELSNIKLGLDNNSLAQDWADWMAELLENSEERPLKRLVFEIREPG